VFLVACTITAISAVVVANGRFVERRTIAAARDSAVALIAPPAEPIAAEARVFMTTVAMLAIEPGSEPRRRAHPRSLATYRALRAYDGAPPRIPHGLTPAEFLDGGCKVCHERGGFSVRFGAYVPVTPHPEMGACLQCHVGDAKLMAVSLPRTEPSDRCRQCHAPGAMKWRDSTLNWKGLSAPPLPPVVPGRLPPPIPHDLQRRENCLACHSSPGAAAGIRTPHAERANCRQCHVEGSAVVAPFERSVLAPAINIGDGT
jgi:cytochrome c-type protein NapB